MNVLETQWWTLALPPEWWADSEEDSILVGDQDDVGCIEISTLQKESGEFVESGILEIAQAESETSLQWQATSLGDFSGYASSYVEEGAAIREWYLANGALMLFVTYSCDEENQGMDDAAVDQLLDTLMLLDNSEQ